VRLSEYDYVVANSSAGKDSQTMLRRIVGMASAEQYPRDRIIVAHADLGQMEWPGTRELAEYQARSYGVRFWSRSRPQNLLAQIEQRGMFPSSQQRYCTSDHKRDQVARLFPSLGDGIKILNCMGMRAEESPVRAKLKPFEINRRATNTRRHVDQWLPIHEVTEDEVWSDIHAAPIPYHYAYDLGMKRLSCVFCIFAPAPALKIAGRHNPLLLSRYVAVESRIGHSFRQTQTLREIEQMLS